MQGEWSSPQGFTLLPIQLAARLWRIWRHSTQTHAEFTCANQSKPSIAWTVTVPNEHNRHKNNAGKNNAVIFMHDMIIYRMPQYQHLRAPKGLGWKQWLLSAFHRVVDHWFKGKSTAVLVDSWFKQKSTAGFFDLLYTVDSTRNQAGVVDLRLILGWPLI